MKTVNLIQAFQSMRIFLEIEYEKTQFDDILTMLTALILCKNEPDWQKNPKTFDAAGWIDWMHCVNEVFKKNNITDNPFHAKITTELAFECMTMYIAYFHLRFSGYTEIGTLLHLVHNAQHTKTGPIWDLWQESIEHAINNTYPLETFC